MLVFIALLIWTLRAGLRRPAANPVAMDAPPVEARQSRAELTCSDIEALVYTKNQWLR